MKTGAHIDRCSPRPRRGLTVVELALFGALGTVVLVGAVGTLARSTKLAEISRRTGGAQIELRLTLETLAEDVAETVWFEDAAPFDSSSAASGPGFRFVVRSTRTESGLAAPAGPSLRRVEYRLMAPAGASGERDLSRSVTLVGPAGGAGSTRTVSRGVARLRLWPIAAVPVSSSKRYNLVAAAEPAARAPLATPACVLVACDVGEALGSTRLEQTPAASLVTKLWCRNRMADLSRGGLR